METKLEMQDVEVEGGEWVAHWDPCLQPAASTLLLSGDTGASLAGSSYLESRQAGRVQASPGRINPLWCAAVSGHLQTTRLHLSFCIADVFLKQLDVSELDRSALLRI